MSKDYPPARALLDVVEQCNEIKNLASQMTPDVILRVSLELAQVLRGMKDDDEIPF